MRTYTLQQTAEKHKFLLFGLLLIGLYGFKRVLTYLSTIFFPDAAMHEAKAKAVDSTSVFSPALTRDSQSYITAANNLYNAMQDAGTDHSKLIAICTPFNAEELKQVYKEFGVRENRVAGFTVLKGNLIEWFETEMSGWTEQGKLDQLKKIWKKTNLW